MIVADNFDYLLKDYVSLSLPKGLVQQSVRISPFAHDKLTQRIEHSWCLTHWAFLFFTE